MANNDPLYLRVRKAYDAIVFASYYGFAFREMLAANPEALEAAEKLAKMSEEKFSFKRTPQKREGE